jgi:hypothetical protein
VYFTLAVGVAGLRLLISTVLVATAAVVMVAIMMKHLLLAQQIQAVEAVALAIIIPLALHMLVVLAVQALL